MTSHFHCTVFLGEERGDSFERKLEITFLGVRMRYWSLPALLLIACFGLFAQAQPASPHIGLFANLSIPTGGFNRTTYGASSVVSTPQTETYDMGIGGQFTVSFPLDPRLAIRLNISDQTTSGRNTAPGYDTINLKHNILCLGGDVQFFPAPGNALDHQGLYFLGGFSADFERFDRSFGDPEWDYTNTSRKSRLGSEIGVGHTFGRSVGGFNPRFSIEGAFHKTLTGCDVDAGDPPATDFARVSIGVVF